MRQLVLYLDLIRFNRPQGWLLLLWPTLSALWLASGGVPSWHLLVIFVLGTFLMRSAGCCFNDAADSQFDRHVARTQNRPLATGALSRKEAVGVGLVLSLVSFVLVLNTNIKTIVLSFIALALALVYPFAKRFVSMPQAVLGIAFSVGIPMACTAVRNDVPAWAYLLMLSNIFWVLAYDTQYAMVDREDDKKIGIKTSALFLGRFDVAAILIFYVLHLGLWALMLAIYWSDAKFLGANGLALAAALLQVVLHYVLIANREPPKCFQAFKLNHFLGFTLFIGIALSLQFFIH